MSQPTATPKPYYDKDGITIYHGDCRDILPGLPNVDLVLTDPPYGIAYETAWRSRSDSLRCPVANDATLYVVAAAWPMVVDRLEPVSAWYAFASPRMVAESAKIYRPTQWLFWDKGDRGTVGDLVAGYGECVEMIAYGHNGRRKLNGPRPRNIIRHDWSASMDPSHPTVKPVPLLAMLIGKSSDHGDTILDPFMGSGTTLVAAKQLGRKAIGIEIEEKYCEIAAKRLAQGVLL